MDANGGLKMKALCSGSVVLGVLLLCGGCSNSNVAVAAKPVVKAYPASIGNLNTPSFALGDVVVLDPETRQATKVGAAQVEPADVTITSPEAGVAEPLYCPIELAYSQQVKDLQKAQVESEVKAHTTLQVENYFERKLTSPEAFVAGDAQLASVLSTFHAAQPQAKFFLVSSVVCADKVCLTYANNPEEIKTGKYTFHVSYPQNAQLEQLVKDQPAFFKLTPVALVDRDGSSAVVVDQSFNEKLPEYNIKSAVAQTE